MEASIGKALREARLKRELTLEEVARVTKTRVDRLRDLENDDYTSFPNLAYARGFLVLYAKFLEVDLSRFHMIDPGNPVTLTDYQYLQNDPGLTVPLQPRRPLSPERRSRWLLAVGVISGALLTAAVTVLLVLNLMRLGSFDQLLEGNSAEAAVLPAAQQTSLETPPATPEPAPQAAAPEPEPEPSPDQPDSIAEEGLHSGWPQEIDLLYLGVDSPERTSALSTFGAESGQEGGEPATLSEGDPLSEAEPMPEATAEPSPEATPAPTPTATPAPTARRRSPRARSTPTPRVRRALPPGAAPTPARR